MTKIKEIRLWDKSHKTTKSGSSKPQAGVLPRYLDMYLSTHSVLGIPCVVNTFYYHRGKIIQEIRNLSFCSPASALLTSSSEMNVGFLYGILKSVLHCGE